jgi:para-aminobenzoate synthetase/4-amino-4-deoxychorismate lyase
MINKNLEALFSGQKNGILLHTACGKNRQSLLFIDPVCSVESSGPSHIDKDLKRVNKLIDSGLYAAGFFSYELGCFLEEKLPVNSSALSSPLFKLMFFKNRCIFNNLKLSGDSSYSVSKPGPSTDLDQYARGFNKIKNLIRNGEIYQANYCFKLDFTLRGSLRDFFIKLAEQQPSAYSAFMRFGSEAVISFSPELFFERTGGRIKMKPMKGTLLKPASKNGLKHFKKDPKTMAENIMIVDLIRNDLGKLCKTKSIKVGGLFEVEEYPTLWQMTSSVSGALKNNPGIAEMLRAIFPSGSVTGAPKIRAMQVIAECEKESRGIYTGALGYISPGKKAVFNIPIRTAVINTVSGKSSFGVGSGIVNDSRLIPEYRECLGKARFLTSDSQGFHLIETILYEAGGYSLLNGHLSRLNASASYFGIPFSKSRAREILLKNKHGINNRCKIRLLLSADGNIKTEFKELKNEQTVRPGIAVSAIRTDSENIFLRHKTSLRALYNNEYIKAMENGLADHIFTNEKCEITEGCVTNIFIRIKGVFYTPPVSCGLLGGVYRQYLLAKAPGIYREKIISLEDLKSAEEIYLCNSVKGLFRVYLD